MKHRPLRRSRAHLDALLDGQVTSGDPLAELVAAVRAPAHATELAGLDAALAAFTSASSVAPAPEEKTPMLKSVAGRLLVLKVLAVAAGTAAAGGVAYAAVNGNLETPHGNSSAVAGSSSADESGSASSSAPGSDDASQSGSSSGSESSGSESGSGSSSASGSESSSEPNGSPSPSLRGLCTAWLAHPKNSNVAGNPAFSVLVKAAGGADAVNGYCTTLLASAHPTHPAHPTQAQNSSHSHPAHPTQANNTKTHAPHPTPTHSHPSQAHNTKSPNPHKP